MTRRAPDSLVLAIACLGQFMVVLDVSVVNVALPSIRHDLGFSGTGLQWIVNAYTIVFAGFLLLGGRAADLFGQRRLYLAGLGLFTLASLAGGLAQGQTTLLLARGAQGLGGAVLSPATLTILTTRFTAPGARARAIGIWSAVAGGGGACGALLGGVLTDLASWRWILFINVPIGLAGLAVARLFLTESRTLDPDRRIDVGGAVLVTAGLVSMVTGIVQSDSAGITSASALGPLGAGVALLAAFVAFEARVAAVPLLPLRLFRFRALSSANGVMFFVASAGFASWYFLSLYLQGSLHYSPLRAGLVFLPQTLSIVAAAQISSRLVGRLGPRALLVAGTLISAAGLAWLSRLGVHGSYAADLMVPSVMTSFGVGLAFTPIALTATSDVAGRDAGLASGLVNTTRQVGGSLGLALLATLAVDRTSALGRAGRTAQAAVVAGFDRAFAVSTLFMLAAAVLAVLTVPRFLHRAAAQEQEAFALAD